MQNQSHLLKSKRFLPLFITQFFGAFNDNVFKNAFLIWFTYYAAQKLDISASIMVTIASGLFILPFFLFSALAGQIADKYEKSKLAQIIKIAEIVIMSLAFFGFYFVNIPLLLTLLFCMGIHSTFFGPIKYSLLPEHLKNSELISGNALIEGGTFLAILLGTIFGGIIILSAQGILITSIAVILFAIIGWLSSRFIPKAPIGDPKLKISFNIIAQTRNIVKYSRKNRLVWRSILQISWFWLIGITFLTQIPNYTKNIINGDEFVVTLFLSIFSVGIGLGSVMCNNLLKGKINERFVPLGLIGITCGIFIFCIASYFYPELTQDHFFGIKEFFAYHVCSWFIVLGLLALAIFSGIYIVPLYAMMQHHSDQKYLSRIIAANNVLNALFMVIASIGAVILFKLKFDVLQIFLLLAIANILVFFVNKRI